MKTITQTIILLLALCITSANAEQSIFKRIGQSKTFKTTVEKGKEISKPYVKKFYGFADKNKQEIYRDAGEIIKESKYYKPINNRYIDTKNKIQDGINNQVKIISKNTGIKEKSIKTATVTTYNAAVTISKAKSGELEYSDYKEITTKDYTEQVEAYNDVWTNAAKKFNN